MGRVSLLAVVLAAAGSVAAAGAYGGLATLELRMLGPQWQLYQAVGGAVLVGVGLVAMFSDLLQRPEPKPSISAQEAFLSRPKAVEPMEPVTPQATKAARNQASAKAAKAAAGEGKPPEDPEYTRVERELREVKRQINKASVMLGTGQLSNEGYTEYVAELKRKRGVLEAELVRLEIMRQQQVG